jgi:hypothetical protein
MGEKTIHKMNEMEMHIYRAERKLMKETIPEWGTAVP